MSLAEAFERRGQQANAKRHRGEPMLERTVFSSADEPQMALGLTNKNRGAGYEHGKQVLPPPGASKSCDDEFGSALGSGSPSPLGDAHVLERRGLAPDLPHPDGCLFPDGAQLPMPVPSLVSSELFHGGTEPAEQEAEVGLENESLVDGTFLGSEFEVSQAVPDGETQTGMNPGILKTETAATLNHPENLAPDVLEGSLKHGRAKMVRRICAELYLETGIGT